LTFKSYTYRFNLPSQVLTSVAAAPNQLQLSAAGGQAPIRLQIDAPTWATYASSNGLSGFADLAVAVPFQMQDCQSFATYCAMYDAYKLGKVSLHLEYLNNMAAVNGSGLMPTCYMYWDQDDAIVPVNINQISGKQGVRIKQFTANNTTMKYTLQPVTTTALAGQSSPAEPPLTTVPFLAGIANKPQWINCLAPTIKHFALKIYITDVYLPGGAANTAFRFNWTYNIAFRSPLNCA